MDIQHRELVGNVQGLALFVAVALINGPVQNYLGE